MNIPPVVRNLHALMKKILLLKVVYDDALNNIQQWLLDALISHIEYDVGDSILCEIEDLVPDGFKAHRQLPYAHYLSYMFLS